MLRSKIRSYCREYFILKNQVPSIFLRNTTWEVQKWNNTVWNVSNRSRNFKNNENKLQTLHLKLGPNHAWISFLNSERCFCFEFWWKLTQCFRVFYHYSFLISDNVTGTNVTINIGCVLVGFIMVMALKISVVNVRSILISMLACRLRLCIFSLFWDDPHKNAILKQKQ